MWSVENRNGTLTVVREDKRHTHKHYHIWDDKRTNKPCSYNSVLELCALVHQRADLVVPTPWGWIATGRDEALAYDPDEAFVNGREAA